VLPKVRILPLHDVQETDRSRDTTAAATPLGLIPFFCSGPPKPAWASVRFAP